MDRFRPASLFWEALSRRCADGVAWWNDQGPASIATARRSLHWAGMALLALLTLTLLLYQTAFASNRIVAECFSWVLVGGMSCAYLLGYRALRMLPSGSKTVFYIAAFAAGFCVIGLLITPFYDVDLFWYVSLGWQQSHYGLNPYAHVIADIPNWKQDPMLHPEWVFIPSPYGFLFTWLTKILCGLGNGYWWLTLLLFKTINVLVFGLAGLMVWLGCRRLGLPSPERALYLLWWNPLLLVLGIAHGHNDLIMAVFTMAAVYFAVAGRWWLVLPALMAATLIKYAAAVLFPFALLFLWRRYGWKRTGAGAVLAAMVAALCALPYLAGEQSFKLQTMGNDLTNVNNSLPALAFFPFEVSARYIPAIGTHKESIKGIIKLMFWVGFAAVYGRLAWRRLRQAGYDAADFVYDCTLIQFVLICLVSSKYYVWYLGMFFPLCLWLPASSRLRRAVLAIAFTQLLALTFLKQAHGINVVLLTLIPLAWAVQAWPFSLLRRPSVASMPLSLAA